MPDEEVVQLINENNDESREYIFKKYIHIIDIYLKKYKQAIYINQIEAQDAYAECLYAFNMAINDFDVTKQSGFATFLSLCIERRLIKVIRRASTEKNKINKSAYSLDYVYEEFGMPLKEILEDNNNLDPSTIIEDEEKFKNLNNDIEDLLSSLEKKVFIYLKEQLSYQEIALKLNKEPKQIDNAIQRIKIKIKELIENRIEI